METGATVYQSVTDSLDWIEKPFYYAGLNTVPKRFIFGSLTMGGLLFYMKPSMLFNSSGQPYPWKLTNGHMEDSVAVPWWIYAMGTGLVLATFI